MTMKRSYVLIVTIMLLSSVLSFVQAAQVGDIISNTAQIEYRIGGYDHNTTTNEVNHTIVQTPATIDFLAYAQEGNDTMLEPTSYLDASGMVQDMPPPQPADGTTLAPPQVIQTSATNMYTTQDLVLVRVVDIDQDTDMYTQQQIEINITNSSSGDREVLLLTETAPNSGVFVGYLHTTPVASSSGDGSLGVEAGDHISAIYMDNGDQSTAVLAEAQAEIVALEFRLLATKSQSKEQAGVGEFVKYSVTIENISSMTLSNIVIEDRLPEGTKYQDGSFKIDGVAAVGTLSADGRLLSYLQSHLPPGATVEMSYVVLITAGIIDGKAVNRAWASAPAGGRSNIATTTLEVKEELYRSKGFILGQVYDANMTKDTNRTSDTNGTEHYGIEGIKLYMEDGRFVVTDKQGKYHFTDVDNGTHVVQMDDASFKGRYKLAKCRDNTRFAGASRSQFVDLYHGEIARVDFCLEQLPGMTGEAKLGLSIRKISAREIELTLSIGKGMQLIDPEVFLALPKGLVYIADSISHHREPEQSEGMLAIKLGAFKKITLGLKMLDGTDPDKEIRGILYFDTAREKNQRSDIVQVMFSTDGSTQGIISSIAQAEDSVEIQSAGARAPLEAGEYNWTKPTHQVSMPEYTPDEVDALGKTPQIVWPPKGWIPDIPSTRVAILYPKGHSVELRLNGRKVSMLNYEGLFRSSSREMNVMHFKGVDLAEGENLFTALIKKGDQVVKRVSREIFVESRVPKHIRLIPEYSYLVADGVHEPIIAVKMTGPSGHPLRGGMVGSFTTDSAHAPAVMSNGKGQYRIDSEGIAYIRLEPIAIAGEATLRFKLYGDKQESLTVRLKPHLRDWILVGFAEGTVGYNTLHGNSESLDNKGVEDSWYHKGRVAFFAKGRIKGKWLLTMAYDSGRSSDDRKLFDAIDPDAYYTLYNDATRQGNEAPSTKKLYLKLERDAYKLLFGDYHTGLSTTELSSYSRSFTGFKGTYKGSNLEATLFVAESDELFFREELRGDGTRGYYTLGQTPIIEGSETVTIEVRDKHREEIVLESRELQRYRDYDIDYDKGTLYFKEPIYSTDREFNPRFIVIKYEVDGDGQDHYTYGGRVSYKSSDQKYQAGATFVNEETGTGENTLYGADLKVTITDRLTLEAEIAKTRNGEDGNKTEGDASKLELTYRDENLTMRAYYRKQDSSFGLGQLSQSLSATRKIGLDINKKLSDKWTLAATLYQNRRYDLNSSNDQQVAEFRADYHEKLWSASVGYRYADNSDTEATHQLTTKVERKLLDGNLTVWVSHDQSLDSNEDASFPTKTAVGMDYKYDTNTTLFGQIERRDGSEGVDWHARMGASYTPWKEGKITYSRLYDSGKDGSQLYDTLGISRTLSFGKRWKWKLGYEKGIAWSEDNRSSKDFDALNVAVNYSGERYSSDLSVGYRNSGTEDRFNLDTGVYIKQSDAMGLAFALGYHKTWDSDSQERDIDARIAFVYRPEMTDWIILERLDLTDDYTENGADRTQTQKLINNLHLHWQPDDQWEFGLHYGLKHVIDEIDEVEYRSWTDLIGINARYDINAKWSVGLQGSVLHSYTGENVDYGIGAFVSATPWQNAEVTLGYNIEGFDDDDFSQQNYYHEGPYLRVRMKFDQESIREVAKRVSR